VTSSCAGKIGLRESGEHTSGPNLASGDYVAHDPTLYTFLENANVRFAPESGHRAIRLACPFCAKRWGNRPASLWIAEDFGCCASG
jgi:hypothetical protein